MNKHQQLDSIMEKLRAKVGPVDTKEKAEALLQAVAQEATGRGMDFNTAMRYLRVAWNRKGD